MQPKISMLPYDASNSSMYAVCICYKYRQVVIRYTYLHKTYVLFSGLTSSMHSKRGQNR